MKKIFFTMSSSALSVPQYFSRPLSKMLCLGLFMYISVLYLQAQCPSPTATTAPITTGVIAASSTTTAAGSGSVTYVNGSVTFGSPSLAYTITISTGTTWVISSGSHLKVSNLNVNGTLIIQDGASVSVNLTTGGSLSVSGSLLMCSSSAIENCGTTTIAQTSSVTYVGVPTAKAVMKFSNAPGFGGSLSMPQTPSSLTNSSNIWLATYPSGSNGGLWNVVGLTGSASTCTIGSNCTGLPYTVSSSCAEFYGQTATGICVDYKLIPVSTNKYQVSMIPKVGWTGTQATTLSQQITLIVPTGDFLVSNLTNLVSGVTYEQTSRFNAPTENPTKDYLVFTLKELGTTNLTYIPDTELPIFNFSNAGSCTSGNVELMNNLTDPFRMPNSSSANVGQQLKTLGSGINAAICLNTNYSTPCVSPPVCATSEVAIINVVPKPDVVVTTPINTICVGGGITLSANITGGVGCSIQWQSSPQTPVNWQDIPSATSNTYTTPALTTSLKYRAITNCTGNGCCN